jgi:hypothetical protein
MQTLLLLFLLFTQGELSRPIAEEIERHGELVEGESGNEICPKMPAGLEGSRRLPRENWWTSLDVCLSKLNEKYWNVAMGGAWKPEKCVAQQRVAILTPNRLTDKDKALNIGKYVLKKLECRSLIKKLF